MELIQNIHVRLFRKGNGKPLKGDRFKVRFYDKDILKDDFLGETGLDDFGHGIVSVTERDFRSGPLVREKYPDVYFEVLESNKVIYRSRIIKNLGQPGKNRVIKKSNDFDLGVFAVR